MSTQQAQAGSSSDTLDGASAQRAEDNTPRVQLACFYCRAKRIRCSGTKPVCTACAKGGATCEWPTGRRRKRTRREMEEARRVEAAATTSSAPGSGMTHYGISPGGANGAPVNATSVPPTASGSVQPVVDISNPWAGAANFVWPPNFLPEGFSFDTLDQPIPGLPAAQMTDLSSLGPLEGFLNDNSPGTDIRFFQALDGTAYLSGDLEDDEVELYYYRFSGTTALNPGINRISLKLHRRDGVVRAPEPESTGTPSDRSMRPPPAPADLFDANGLPHKRVFDPIFEKFLKHMSQHFPSVSRLRMEERYASGTMSAFLANCILALGARFGGESDADGVAACAPFVAKAQELVIPLLHLPAYDVATGLLMLAWASYGQNSDSGLWQYSGMAIRMAIDLGVHENSEMYEDQAHLVRTRLLFWTLFVTDRVVAFATGRAASIPEDIIEIPLPEDTDFFPDPARNTPQFMPEAIQPVPFVYLTRLMIICGRISNVLNGRRGRARTLVSTDEPLVQQLAELQAHLVKFYASLPEQMRWSADNFKHQHGRGHGGTFLALHLWAHAVLALVYHPDLLKSPSGQETPLNRSMPRNVKLAIASSRQIGECMVFADLVSHSSYTATPIVVQPIYVAAMALIHEMHAAQAQARTRTPTPVESDSRDSNTPMGGAAHASHASDLFLVSMAKQNFTALLRAISRVESYWAGAGYVAALLEKRSGIAAPARAKKTFISLPDQGLLRRFKTDVRDDPRNVAPATETSLRESIARSASGHSAGPSPVWVSDLLNGYSVENMSFAPADQFDFARLMAAAGGQPGESSEG
ncbi:uncharacterized protein CcaverHIS019_0410090 [Cutaneotrichosporon cavernicola]|uniref:Zn(2)-C6 fungal-type domain-containing protein n=1 Tax=Cutaneotrichosporon cavernicola TaxID=279322 RepID=A0AA48QW88_9TREE|nr:uncharacterized protein CcaverHIS019_0410090 [Cutaneotrichosporon cavernicola]BEI92189.1 hypothetical protein CcaverHIS019_0410090 [Cutaneotrichosporon cavernicola]BEI99960.1 hypothetical protein CcaverHIS631_0410030 [Cutaneotrichosporon cavernicola]BEJ07734.1 hypothetical protein CcaverHIS641_0410030 [Cutaneotrichosporon cavernicola]